MDATLYLVLGIAIAMAIILVTAVVVWLFRRRGGKHRLERANRSMVSAAYEKAAIIVDGNVMVLRAEGQAAHARQALRLGERIPQLFAGDDLGDEGPPPPPTPPA